MDSESVGSNLPSPLFANPNQQQKSIEPLKNNLQNPLPISQRSQRDTCFYCKKQGHWSINCPEKQKTLVNKQMTTTMSPSPTTPSSGGGATIITIPDMQCPCGGGLCYIRTSKTEKNPGRQFYKCPRRSACSFFQWCDEHSSDQGVGVAVFPYPMCSCGAGTCNRHKVMKEGNNKGRFFFVCPVTKGQGACNFFQWEDEIKQSPQSTLAVQESPSEMVVKTIKHGPYGQYRNQIKESFSPESVVRGTESPLREEYPVKEEGEVGRSHSGGVDEKILSPMRNLRVSEESNTTSPVAKPGQWMKECFKCGKTGHWMRDCTA